MPPLVRFPAGPITPHGAYHILRDRIPQMALRSYDDTVVFNMLGGLAMADKVMLPGRVEIKDLKGLIPPWRTIDQKGATQDGITFVTALYDAIECELDVRVKGKDPADCRRVARYLMDSIDVKQQSELSWFTHQLGRWWSPIRWFKTPIDPVGAIRNKTQDLSLRLRADSGFWQSYPSVDQFAFGFATTSDSFSIAYPSDLGPGWTVALSGSGTGNMFVANGQASSTLVNGRTAVARKVGYTSGSDNQVIDIEMGTLPQWFYPTDAYVDIWTRMGNTGTPGTNGIRLRMRRHQITLSCFVSGIETILRQKNITVPLKAGDKLRFITGDDTGPRSYTLTRGGAKIMSVKETGTTSQVGSTFRGAGLGMSSNGTDEPPSIRSWGAGDNATVTQSDFLERFNVGDQPMWDNYTCFGPGIFRFWNGPNAGANEYVEFGTLLPNQIMYVRTDPQKRGVIDMTVIPPTPQQLNAFQLALKDFLDFATGNNSTPLATEIESIFGVKAPQGNPYSLLKGRFSKPIPQKSPGQVAQPYYVKVQIVNGNSDSCIIAAGTPRRRMPF